MSDLWVGKDRFTGQEFKLEVYDDGTHEVALRDPATRSWLPPVVLQREPVPAVGTCPTCQRENVALREATHKPGQMVCADDHGCFAAWSANQAVRR